MSRAVYFLCMLAVVVLAASHGQAAQARDGPRAGSELTRQALARHQQRLKEQLLGAEAGREDFFDPAEYDQFLGTGVDADADWSLDELKAKASAAGSYLNNRYQEAKSAVTNTATTAHNYVTQKAEEAKQDVQETVQQASETVDRHVDRIQEAADEVRSSARDTAQRIHETVIQPVLTNVNAFLDNSPSALRLVTCLKDVIKNSSGGKILPTNIFASLAGGMPHIAPKVLSFLRRLILRLYAQLHQMIMRPPQTLRQALDREWGRLSTMDHTALRVKLLTEVRRMSRFDQLSACILPFIEQHISAIARGIHSSFISLKTMVTEKIEEVGYKGIGLVAMIAIDQAATFFQDPWAVHFMRSAATEELLQVPRQQEIATLMEQLAGQRHGTSDWTATANQLIGKLEEPYQVDSRVLIRLATPAARIVLGVGASKLVGKIFPIIYNRLVHILLPVFKYVAEFIVEIVSALGDVFTEWIGSGIDKIIDFAYSIAAVEMFTKLAQKATRICVNLFTNFVLQPAALAANGGDGSNDSATARMIQSITSGMSPETRAKLERVTRGLLSGFGEGYIKPMLESLRTQNTALARMLRSMGATGAGASSQSQVADTSAQERETETQPETGTSQQQQVDSKPFHP
eukprot:TRINITY_DN3494_c0_g1_i1.p1 TRINITY_DN3494_c0_g1~~TRINITY_DN3494_c0_g1_i1.p1  ORF type:complete len:632 (-),score=187.06 TRINITY_DN3494_c0_g1_i1:69-1964(-)